MLKPRIDGPPNLVRNTSLQAEYKAAKAGGGDVMPPDVANLVKLQDEGEFAYLNPCDDCKPQQGMNKYVAVAVCNEDNHCTEECYILPAMYVEKLDTLLAIEHDTRALWKKLPIYGAYVRFDPCAIPFGTQPPTPRKEGEYLKCLVTALGCCRHVMGDVVNDGGLVPRLSLEFHRYSTFGGTQAVADLRRPVENKLNKMQQRMQQGAHLTAAPGLRGSRQGEFNKAGKFAEEMGNAERQFDLTRTAPVKPNASTGNTTADGVAVEPVAEPSSVPTQHGVYLDGEPARKGTPPPSLTGGSQPPFTQHQLDARRDEDGDEDLFAAAGEKGSQQHFSTPDSNKEGPGSQIGGVGGDAKSPARENSFMSDGSSFRSEEEVEEIEEDTPAFKAFQAAITENGALERFYLALEKEHEIGSEAEIGAVKTAVAQFKRRLKTKGADPAIAAAVGDLGKELCSAFSNFSSRVQALIWRSAAAKRAATAMTWVWQDYRKRFQQVINIGLGAEDSSLEDAVHRAIVACIPGAPACPDEAREVARQVMELVEPSPDDTNVEVDYGKEMQDYADAYHGSSAELLDAKQRNGDCLEPYCTILDGSDGTKVRYVGGGCFIPDSTFDAMKETFHRNRSHYLECVVKGKAAANQRHTRFRTVAEAFMRTEMSVIETLNVFKDAPFHAIKKKAEVFAGCLEAIAEKINEDRVKAGKSTIPYSSTVSEERANAGGSRAKGPKGKGPGASYHIRHFGTNLLYETCRKARASALQKTHRLVEQKDENGTITYIDPDQHAAKDSKPKVYKYKYLHGVPGPIEFIVHFDEEENHEDLFACALYRAYQAAPPNVSKETVRLRGGAKFGVIRRRDAAKKLKAQPLGTVGSKNKPELVDLEGQSPEAVGEEGQRVLQARNANFSSRSTTAPRPAAAFKRPHRSTVEQDSNCRHSRQEGHF